MKLVKLTMEHVDKFAEMHAEFPPGVEGGGLWQYPVVLTDPAAIIERAEQFDQGANLPSDGVPSTSYCLLVEDKFVGAINIRHSLNDFLLRIGGHIGYCIRPTERRKGYASKMLALSLVEAKTLGLEQVLVTCSESNVASRKVIEKNGGVYENSEPFEPEAKRRYWITV